jgi:hypothetical protein
MAQQTKAGNVYVISNVGTFGAGVFKVGMTRRLEPLDRIRELGDASVPFPFDVHMMISCEDAPALECALHRALHKSRINRVNPRKEFFRTDLQLIVDVVQEHHGCVDYAADPEALVSCHHDGPWLVCTIVKRKAMQRVLCRLFSIGSRPRPVRA